MTLEDVMQARLDYQAHQGCRVTEVHVSPGIQRNSLTLAGGWRPVRFLPEIGQSVKLHGADWFVDCSLRGNAYRFVTEPRA